MPKFRYLLDREALEVHVSRLNTVRVLHEGDLVATGTAFRPVEFTTWKHKRAVRWKVRLRRLGLFALAPCIERDGIPLVAGGP